MPKTDTTLRSIGDFREVNTHIKRKPFPLPKISDLLQKLEGFTYATSLDLTMGYYCIALTPEASKLCTVVLPWGKYEYLKLPMGLCNSPDIFQEKMIELMEGLEFVRAYLDTGAQVYTPSKVSGDFGAGALKSSSRERERCCQMIYIPAENELKKSQKNNPRSYDQIL